MSKKKAFFCVAFPLCGCDHPCSFILIPEDGDVLKSIAETDEFLGPSVFREDWKNYCEPVTPDPYSVEARLNWTGFYDHEPLTIHKCKRCKNRMARFYIFDGEVRFDDFCSDCSDDE